LISDEIGTILKFLQNGANLDHRDEYGMYVFHNIHNMWAIYASRSARVCEMLIQAGAELELEDDSGATALHHAF